MLGPILVLKLKFTPGGPPAAVWSPSCGSTRTTRASWSCPRSARRREAFQVATEVRVFLAERGVDLSGEQETKTQKALEFFSEQLQQAPA